MTSTSSDIAVANGLVQRMVGGQFSGCFVGFDLHLHVQRDAAADVIQASTFVLYGPDGDTAINSEAEPSTAAPLLGLLRVATVQSIAVTEPGNLEVVFSTGHRFTLESDPHYEGWQINSDDGLLIVALPGGDVAVWEPGSGNVARGGKGRVIDR